MRKTVVWLLVAGCTSTAPVAVTSIASAPRPRPIPQRALSPGALRVMSYNVNFGIAGDPSTVAAVERAAPDVVVFQETNDVWRDALIAGLPRFSHHAFVPPADLPAGGMGVLSIYPITSIERLPSQGRSSRCASSSPRRSARSRSSTSTCGRRCPTAAAGSPGSSPRAACASARWPTTSSASIRRCRP